MMSNSKTIFDIDFAELYRNHVAQAIRQPKTSDDWDKKAHNMKSGGGCAGASYIQDFTSRMDLTNTSTLLDVGCGGGTIGLALASGLEKVYELDYSPKMLEVVKERAAEQNIENYECILKSWDDNWDDVPECDICVSSRSSMVNDIESALTKLNSKAKKAVYMTMTVDKDFISREILRAIGRDDIGFPTYIYAMNLLYQQGYRVSVDFLETQNCSSKMLTLDEPSFIEAVQWSIGTLNEEEIDRLVHYYQKNQSKLYSAQPMQRAWAFIHWKTH